MYLSIYLPLPALHFPQSCKDGCLFVENKWMKSSAPASSMAYTIGGPPPLNLFSMPSSIAHLVEAQIQLLWTLLERIEIYGQLRKLSNIFICQQLSGKFVVFITGQIIRFVTLTKTNSSQHPKIGPNPKEERPNLPSNQISGAFAVSSREV